MNDRNRNENVNENENRNYGVGADENPLTWLNIRPEYIDSSVDQLIQYLYDRRDKGTDTFHELTLKLLKERVALLWDDIATRPIGDIVNDKSRSEQTVREIRILALSMLTTPSDTATSLHKSLACIYLLMVQVCHETYHEMLLNAAVRALTSTGRLLFKFGWNDVRYFESYLFMKTLQRTEFPSSKNERIRWYAGNGTAMLKDRCLSMMAMSPAEYQRNKTQRSLSLCDDRLEVRSLPRMRMNQTRLDDYDTLERFFKDQLQAMVPVEMEVKKKLRYAEGDSLMVRIVKASGDRVEVVSTDNNYERISGICFYANKFFYTINDFGTHLEEGYDIPVTLKYENGDRSVFDLTGTFKDYLFDECEGTFLHAQVLARAVEVKNGYMWWWSEYGFSVSTVNKDYKVGSYAWMTISHKAKEQGYINAIYDYPAEEDEQFSDYESRHNCIKSFCFEPDDQWADDADGDMLDASYLRIFARIVYVLQKSVSLPLERFKLLGATRLLSKLTGDDTAMHYADFTAQSLRNMVSFARGHYHMVDVPVADRSIASLPNVVRRRNILNTLKQYGKNPDTEFLNSMIGGDDKLLSDMAQLILHGNELRGVLTGAIQHQIEREITHRLTVDEEAQTDLTDGDDDYFGVEDDRKEFKTSFVFPPDNHMQANPTEQRRNVFKGVCAMLNSREGGVLYLGVNDQGVVSGIQSDLTALRLNTMDAYMRHITDEAKKAFGLELMPYIHLELMHEDRVVAIKVEPCDFKIVELDGVAYVRTNAESRKMDDTTRMYILNRKLHFDASRAQIENALSSAIEHHCQALLQSYRSATSGKYKNRPVEPFAFTKGNKHIWCFALDTYQVELFSIARIGGVKIEEHTWEHQEAHTVGKTDLFHATGPTPTRIQLLLDPLAYNHLIEEFDGSESQLTSTKDGRWILDTEVLDMQGVGRFYIGLAKNIEIINAPGLKEYARQYINESKIMEN